MNCDLTLSKLRVIANRAFLTSVRCEVISLRIATASLAVASSVTSLALACSKSSCDLILNGDIVATCESTYSCSCDIFLLYFLSASDLPRRAPVISTRELGMVGLAAASICSRLANVGAGAIHAYSASPLTPSTIFVKSGSM